MGDETPLADSERLSVGGSIDSAIAAIRTPEPVRHLHLEKCGVGKTPDFQKPGLKDSSQSVQFVTYNSQIAQQFELATVRSFPLNEAPLTLMPRVFSPFAQ